MSLLDATKVLQRIGREPPFSDIVDVQTDPSPDIQNDDDLLKYVRRKRLTQRF